MLDRPTNRQQRTRRPKRAASDPDRSRGLRAERDRRYRERVAAGLAIAPEPYNGDIENYLVRTKWLVIERDGDSAAAIGDAIHRMIADAVKAG